MAQPTQVVATTSSTVNVDAILATIRQVESGNNYSSLTHGTGGASGAYQYEPATWTAMLSRAISAGLLPASDSQYGYAAAAPVAVQDTVARYDVTTFLNSVGGNVALVPLHWYYPASINNPSLLGYTPPGNSISIGNYQSHWLSVYGGLAGLSPSQLAALPSTGAQQAVTTSVGSDILGGFKTVGDVLLAPGQGLGDALKLFGVNTPLSSLSSGVKIFLGIFSNWHYIAEVLIGLALVGVGVVVVLADTGSIQKAAPIAAAAAA